MAKSAKKGAAAALQTDVTTDDEWNEILNRKGLVVVDVYTEWSGPCAAMISTLRKIKMEIGGDVLSYAIARNDEISSLERFRGRSEPVWMFLQNGKMVNLVFGAHCPNLQRLLIDELRRVQQDEPPKWNLSVGQRGPEEESRWQHKEIIRKAKEDARIASEEADKRAKYENFMDQEMFELCEETALILYPWVFLDDDGNPRDKGNCPAYTELVQHVINERFDILEQSRPRLNDETIEKLFVESQIEISEDLIEGLTQDTCMAIRLRGKPPDLEWPVPYPHECPGGAERCPVRAIDDIENYLRNALQASMQTDRSSIEGSYLDRHVYVRDPDPDDEQDRQKIYPAIWFPPNVKYKSGNEIFVIVLRRTDDEAFLAFAGNEPYFVTEDNDEAERIIEEYFPVGSVDAVVDDPDDKNDFYDYYDEDANNENDEEDEEDYEDEDEDNADVPPSFVDLSIF